MCAYDYGDIKKEPKNKEDSLCGNIQNRIRYFYRNSTDNLTDSTDYSIQLDKIIEQKLLYRLFNVLLS